MLHLKKNTPFTSCISKIKNTLTGKAGGLDTVMIMHSLVEYISNYLMTSGSLWNYHRDEIDDVNENASEGK